MSAAEYDAAACVLAVFGLSTLAIHGFREWRKRTAPRRRRVGNPE